MTPEPTDVLQYFSRYEGLDPWPGTATELGGVLLKEYIKIRDRALEGSRLTPRQDEDVQRRLAAWEQQPFARRAMLAVMLVSLEIGVEKDRVRRAAQERRITA